MNSTPENRFFDPRIFVARFSTPVSSPVTPEFGTWPQVHDPLRDPGPLEPVGHARY